MESWQCSKCGAWSGQGAARFCGKCGAPHSGFAGGPAGAGMSGGMAGMAAMPGGAGVAAVAGGGMTGAGMTAVAAAMPGAGIMAFSHRLSAAAGPGLQALNPLVTFGRGILNLFRGMGRSFTDIRLLIPALLLVANWITLTLLPLFGVNFKGLNVWAWLTNGGTGAQGGVLGIAGGVFGKGVFAMFFMSLLVPLFQGRNPFKQYAAGFKEMFSGSGITLKEIALLCLGIGLAVTAFQFMTYSASPAGGMTAIAGCFVSVRSLASRSGFLPQLVGGLVSKTGQPVDTGSVRRFISGLALGFALSGGLMFIPLNYWGYIIGGSVAALGLVLLVIALLVSSQANTGTRK